MSKLEKVIKFTDMIEIHIKKWFGLIIMLVAVIAYSSEIIELFDMLTMVIFGLILYEVGDIKKRLQELRSSNT